MKGFVQQDQTYSSDYAHRPPLLFEWDARAQSYGRPTGIMMIGNDVVIDHDDKEIRLFPGVPDVLSSKIEGADVEYYKRQHKMLTYFDLIGEYGTLLTTSSSQLMMESQPGCHLTRYQTTSR